MLCYNIYVHLERGAQILFCNSGSGGDVARRAVGAGGMIRFHNVTVNYNRHPALHHVSGTFARGALAAVVGPNGGGKSTLLKAIAGLLQSESGSITFDGITRRDVAYLPQVSEIQRDFPISVLQMVASGHWQRCGSFGGIDAAMLARAREALALVGLAGFDERAVETLSAGQFQRALFARLWLQQAQVLLLDEPFAAIDDETAAQLMEVILGWHREGRTVICVLHDIGQIQRYFPECVLLARECIAWCKTPDAISAANRTRTKFFNAAWPERPEICETA